MYNNYFSYSHINWDNPSDSSAELTVTLEGAGRGWGYTHIHTVRAARGAAAGAPVLGCRICVRARHGGRLSEARGRRPTHSLNTLNSTRKHSTTVTVQGSACSKQ